MKVVITLLGVSIIIDVFIKQKYTITLSINYFIDY